MDTYKEIISNLIAKDGETNEMLLREIAKLDNNDKQIIKLIEDNRKIGRNNYERTKINQANLFQLISTKYESLIDNCYDIKNNLNEIKESLTEVKSNLRSQNDSQLQIKTILTDAHTKLDNLLDQKEELNHSGATITFDGTKCKQINIEDFKGYFDEESEFNFKILIFDCEKAVLNKINKEKLIDWITLSKWNIIIDLDPHCKALDSISNDICKKFLTNYVKEEYNQLKVISQSDMRCIVNGDFACYILANEPENKELELPENIEDDLQIFFERFYHNQRTYMCTNLFLKQNYTIDYLKSLDEINKAIKKALYRINKNEKLDLIYLMFNDLENIQINNETKSVFEKKLNNIEKKMLISSSNKFLTQLTPKCESVEESLYLPGNDNGVTKKDGVTWSYKDNRNYSAFLEVYHTNIGKVQFNCEEESDNFIEKKKFNYIIGNEIDPETIYLNDELKHPTYVETRLMKELYESILRKSEKKDFYKNNKLVREIFHFPYTGGTTIGRVVLYRLRVNLPCFKILYLDKEDKLIEALKTVSIASDLPLVILIDTDSYYGPNNEPFAESDVEEFNRRLGTVEKIRHFIIFVQRSFYNNHIKLNANEISAYEKLYKDYLEKNTSSQTRKYAVFTKNLITIKLLCLKPSHQKEAIEKVAKDYLNLFDSSDRTLLILMHIFDKYGPGGYFDTDLFAFILHEPRESLIKQFSKRDNENDKPLHKIFHILKYRPKYGFKLLNIYLSEKILELICLEEKKHILTLFFDEFISLCQLILPLNDEIKRKALVRLTHNLLIDTHELRKKLKEINRESDSENEDCDDEVGNEIAVINYDDDEKLKNQFFSSLITECSKNVDFGTDETVSILERIYKLFFEEYNEVSPYLGSVLARLLFHNKGLLSDQERAIQLMEEVLNTVIKNKHTTINSYVFFGAYGDLLRHFTNSNIRCQREKDPKDRDPNVIIKLAERSLEAYEKSLLDNDNNPLSLIGECKIRKIILFYYFNQVCGGSSKVFTEKVQDLTTSKIVRESEDMISRKLEKLETLKELYSTPYYYNLDNLYYECMVKVLEIRLSRNLESFAQINSLPEYFGLNVFRILKKHAELS